MPDEGELKMSTELRKFEDYGAVFVEITALDHGHGGPGWELGRCMWSPTENKAGHDRYALMREPAPGDLVLHLVAGVPGFPRSARFFLGWSHVAQRVRTVKKEPPKPGQWRGMSPFYRVDLKGYTQCARRVDLSAFLKERASILRPELERSPPDYALAPYGRGSMRCATGLYLRRAGLVLFRELLGAAGETPSSFGNDSASPSPPSIGSPTLVSPADYEMSQPERGLVGRFVAFMAARGCSFETEVAIEGGGRADLVDRDGRLVIEAKATSDLPRVWQAIGQVSSYARRLPGKWNRALLLPGEPGEVATADLRAHGIGLFVESEERFRRFGLES